MSKQITTINQDLINQITNNMPMENSIHRLSLPRLGMFSQDQVEGKGKSMVVTAEAGTFYIEKATDEVDENGKKVWIKEELGKEIEATVVYYRKQLSMYDSATEKYTNSAVYDNDTDIIPLFCDKKEIAKGTQSELKAKYKFIDPKDNKTKSKLQDMKILFVLHKGEVYQLNLKGTSMFSFMTYLRNSIPSTVLTTFNSEAKEQGTTSWNMMSFKTKRPLDNDELQTVIDFQTEIKDSVRNEKEFYASLNGEQSSGIDMNDWKRDAIAAPEF